MANFQVEDQVRSVPIGGEIAMPPEEEIKYLNEDEAGILTQVPAIDLKKFTSERPKIQLVGQGFVDNFVNLAIHTPAVYAAFIGRKKEAQDPRMGVSFETKVGEKLRNFEILVRHKWGMEQEQIAPHGVGETVAFGVGGLAGYIGAIAALAYGGAAAVTAVGGSAASAAIVGGVIAPFAANTTVMKANAIEGLTSVGYDPNTIDILSDVYGASMGLIGFGVYSKFLQGIRPAVSASVAQSGERWMGGALASKAGQAVMTGERMGLAALKISPAQVIKHSLETGALLATATAFSNEFEIATKMKSREFQQDMTNVLSQFIVGTFVGGASGSIGQLRVRRTSVKMLQEKYGFTGKEAAMIHDDLALYAHDMVLENLTQQVDVADQVKWIQKGFDKAMGKSGVVNEETPAGAPAAEEFVKTQNLLNAEPMLVEAKTKELMSQVKDIHREKSNLVKEIAKAEQDRVNLTRERFVRENKRQPNVSELQQWSEKRASELEVQTTKLKVKLDQANQKLDIARAEHTKALAGNPALLALEQERLAAQEKLDKADLQKFLAGEGTADLFQILRSEGGIAPYKKGLAGALVKEYKGIPKHLKNKKGKTLDIMADTLKQSHPKLGIETEAQLLDAISKEVSKPPVPEDVLTNKEKRDLSARVKAIETRMEGISSPEETIKVAEQKADQATTDLVKSFEKLTEAETTKALLKNDPEGVFVAEKGRAPESKDELRLWREKKTEEINNEIKDLKSQSDQLSEDVTVLENQAEAFRQGVLQVEGRVGLLASQVMRMAKQDLSNALEAYKAGRRLSLKEFKGVQKAFKLLLQGTNLSKKATALLLRKVLTVRTADQFQSKIGIIMDAVNTVIRSDQVRDIQNLGYRILNKMKTSEQMVGPDDQIFAEHLRRVFRGDVPQVYDRELLESDKEVVKFLYRAQVEQAVFDLKNAGDDVPAAVQAFKTLDTFYRDGVQNYANKKAQLDLTYQTMRNKWVKAIENKKGAPATITAIFDRARQKAMGKKEGFAPLPYTASFMRLLETIDPELAKQFDPNMPYNKFVVLHQKAAAAIDGKLHEIYGKKYMEKWQENMSEDFLKVKRTNAEGETSYEVVSRGTAMTMWLEAQTHQGRQELLNMGADAEWVEAFAKGENVNFTEADYKAIQNAREFYDSFPELIAPLFEKHTGKPFRTVDNYVMRRRFMGDRPGQGSLSDTKSLAEMILGGDFRDVDPSDINPLKKRTGSEEFLLLPDLYQNMTEYAKEMNHFLAYMDYAAQLKEVFGSTQMKELMQNKLHPGIPPIIERYIEGVVNGGLFRSVDKLAMGMFNRVLGWYARNKISNPKAYPRQLTGLAAFTQYEGVGAIELAQAMADLHRAFQSGDIKALTETAYWKKRYSGDFDLQSAIAQEQARFDWFAAKGKDPLSVVKKFGSSKMLHDVLTAPALFGDMHASLIGGWAVFRAELARQGTPLTPEGKKLAVSKAIDAANAAIEHTQQPMNYALLPNKFSETDLMSRLVTVFNRTPAKYLDNILRIWELKKQGKMTNPEFIRSVLTYHVWIPLFDMVLSAGAWKTGEAIGSLLAGPFQNMLIVGQAVKAVAMSLVDEITQGEMDINKNIQGNVGGNLITSLAADVAKIPKKIMDFLQYPDYETMWPAAKAISKVADAGPIPASWTLRSIEGVYELLSMEPELMIEGIKQILGYSESRAKNE